MRIVGSESPCRGEVARHPDRFEDGVVAIAFAQPFLDQPDREMRDVDPEPAPPHLLRRIDRGAAAAKGVEHDIARIG